MEKKEVVEETVKPKIVNNSVDDIAVEKEKEPTLLNRLRRFSISQVQVGETFVSTLNYFIFMTGQTKQSCHRTV